MSTVTSAGAPIAEQPGHEDDIVVTPEPSLARSLLKSARPKQWVKNVLVFAAPAAAGALTQPDVLGEAVLAFVAFTLASMSTYYLNDVMDYDFDRVHPKKRYRPIAAGLVSRKMAIGVSSAALAISLTIAFGALNYKFGFLVLGYVALTVSYSTWLKHVAVFDLACVAAGFILRMIGGGLATDLYISEWFLTVGCFSSLFVVTGKRYAESKQMGEGNTESRAVMAQYTTGYLRAVWTMAMTVSIASYLQWAFSRSGVDSSPIWYQLSAVPWTIALLRYALELDKDVNAAGAPEDILIDDRVLASLGIAWLVLFGIGVYAG